MAKYIPLAAEAWDTKASCACDDVLRALDQVRHLFEQRARVEAAKVRRMRDYWQRMGMYLDDLEMHAVATQGG